MYADTQPRIASLTLCRSARSPTQLDLCSQASVKAAAAAFCAKHERLHLLFNNAAVMGTPFATTADGFEEQMAATHFGHFALTGHLMDKCAALSCAALSAKRQALARHKR
jgi:NAD(P)-dependent dehydrogenase (short-subunit alcohol dehydrogenase family)